MSQQHITQIGNTAAVLLPPDVLEQIGFHIGDTVEMSVIDGMLVVSSLQEIERQHKIREATRKVFANRKNAYQRLA